MEPIKQEIVNNIYENGENLITGPVLQEVLLDMVDDTNAKISSSVGDVVTLITEVSESALKPEDLEGYATEQWVEEQGYLKEVPEGYATTESLNQLSESVSASISSIPSVDLSGYATTQSVNEATESVKEWVEAKHYLTTASLSGSVTEESVQFMINDSTASMKEWVQEQDYATKTYVSESIAGLDIPDTSGFVTTQSYNQDSASFDERINAITGSDLSGYATTESLNQLSESVASDSASFDERINSIVVPDLSSYATTESLNQVSESVASDITSLSESIAAITGSDLSGYATTESLNSVSQSLSASIAAITGSGADLSGYVTTASYNQDSASFDQRIDAISSSIPDLSSYATTESLNQFSESVAQDLEGKADKSDLPDLSTYATTESLNQLSESLSESIPDVSIYATTESLNTVSQSLSASIAAITGSEVDLSGYVTTASYNTDSASFDQRIDAISPQDLSIYATTASLNALSSSINNTFNQYATTQSVTLLSQSISQSISNISGSGGDLSALADPSDPDNPVFLALASASFAEWDMDYHGGEWRINVPLQGMLEGEASSFWDLTDVISPLERYFLEAGIWRVNFQYDEEHDLTSWSIDTNNAFNESTWQDNPVYKALESLGLAEWIEDGGGYWSIKEPEYFTLTSASFDQRINSITASGGGADTVLREYLFGTASLGNAGTIYPSASSNWVWEVSESRTFPLGAEVGEGKSIQVIVHNVGANEVTISFNDEYWGPYSVVNGALGSGSFTIKAGEYGDVVATQIGDKIYFRTSVDLSNIDVDLSGYATTSSVQAISSSLGNYLPLAGGTLTGNLKVQSANVSFGNESNPNTIDYAHNGFVAGEGNYLGAHWDECAIGRYNRAEDDFAIALGCNNQVGKLAQGMGVKTVASAQLSTAIGHGVTAKACGQVVIGSFNELDPSGSSTTTGSYAVILGNGLTENWNYDNPGNITRQNGLAIKWNGDIEINYSGSKVILQDKLAEVEGYHPWKDWGYVSSSTVSFISDSKVISNNNYDVNSDLSLALGSIPAGYTVCANFHNLSGATITLDLPATNVDGKTMVYNCLPGSSSMHLMPYAWAPLVCTAINDSVILCSFPQEVI